ncbi:hypothetical protein [Neobacillus drentensis]|uniref:hypothetical protein n=1 Tax=Neobacillus drentensis TaxID=220684 RepID=UPI0030028630
MPLSTKFDVNEIFIIILAIILSLIVVKLFPKRFTYTTSIVLYLFNISTGIAVDHILAGPPLDLYDVFDMKKFELFDLILYLFVYGPVTYIIIFIYDKWFIHKSNLKKFIFLIFISLLNMGMEFIAAKLNVYTYSGWHLYYSFPVYFMTYFISIFFLHLLKNRETRG